MSKSVKGCFLITGHFVLKTVRQARGNRSEKKSVHTTLYNGGKIISKSFGTSISGAIHFSTLTKCFLCLNLADYEQKMQLKTEME